MSVRSEITGLTVSTDAQQMAAAIDELTMELLRYGDGAGRFLDALALDPRCAIANALAATLHLFTMSREGIARAAPFVAAARQQAAAATKREQAFIAAVDDWFCGRTQRAIDRHREILQAWPTDLLSLKLLTYHQLNRGAFDQMLQDVEAVLPVNGHVSYLGGIHAFALGQCGRHAEAEEIGRRAATEAVDPWAQHAVAHVLDCSGAAVEGAAFMAAHAGDWERCSSFLFTHNWWHSALFQLALGDEKGALRLYDERVWTRRKDYCQDQVNAVALLTRLELAGVDVGTRWVELSSRIARRAQDHISGFLDLHYLIALVRGRRDEAVADMLASLADWAAAEGAAEPELTATIGQAAWAIVAWGRSDHKRAATLFAAVRPHLPQLGGSDVQRALFELILVDASARSGDEAGCRRLQRERLNVVEQTARARRLASTSHRQQAA